MYDQGYLRLLLILFVFFVLISGMYRLEFKCAGILNEGSGSLLLGKRAGKCLGRVKIFGALILGG